MGKSNGKRVILPQASGTPADAAAARAAGLRHASDTRPGIRRVRRGSGFVYTAARGRRVRDARTLARIRGLAIPPAWRDVWICDDPRGHLQAVGRDARGRKQYRYHPDWRRVRDETKYDRLIGFARALPAIRRKTSRLLAQAGLTREKVLAAAIQLLEKTLIRVGNEEYTRHNRSFGLTTLRDGHVEVRGARIRFMFRGKSGVEHEVDLDDRRLARVVKACRDIPGYELFQYYDADDARQSIDSADVNDYLRQLTGEDYTSKDFRTWAGTVMALGQLLACRPCRTQAEAKRNIVRAVEAVAERLGNTKAVCRKSYIHPAVFEAYETDALPNARGGAEAAALALLSRRRLSAPRSGSRRSSPRSRSAGPRRSSAPRAGGGSSASSPAPAPRPRFRRWSRGRKYRPSHRRAAAA
jgi:DNA topoisomerase-1